MFSKKLKVVRPYSVLHVLALTTATFAATPNFDMVGFATLEGGTTGGNGGKVVEVSNFEEFKQYAEDLETPYVIIVKGEINTGIKTHIDGSGHIATSGTETTYGELVQLGNNKTIVGKGDKAFFNRVGLAIQNKHNIIIRNIKFTMSDVPISKTDENKVVAFRNGAEVVLNDPDCIAISADSAVTNWEGKSKQSSHNIWIDHCEFYNAATENKDRYDGLLDAKNNIYNATFSWNYFHDHHKGSLIGNSNGDSLRHEITFHHNYYKNLDARVPMMRYNNSHLFNNFIEGKGTGNGTNVRKGSDVYIENNHYAGLSKAIFAGDDGIATIVNNYYEGCANFMSSGCGSKKMRISVNPGTSLSSADTASVSLEDEIKKGSFDPKKFYSYSPDPVSDVKSLVTTYAGIGKIDISDYENGTKIEPVLNSSSSETAPASSSSKESDPQGVISSTMEHVIPPSANIQIFSMTGKLICKGVYAEREQIKARLPQGNYLTRVQGKSYKINLK